MKKKLVVSLVLIICLLVPMTVWAASTQVTANLASHLTLLVKGRAIDTSADTPLIYNEKTYVPLRVLSEALGYEVKWNGENSTIEFELPKESYPLIRNEEVDLISVAPNYELISQWDQEYLAGIEVDVAYTVKKDLTREPVVVLEMLSKDHVVIASGTQLLNTKKGTHKAKVSTSKIRLPYGPEADVKKTFAQDYYYRVSIK
ncbi:stalk domain-containing protein [Paenibacillus ehimensis]|uniref:stalk domain-containing protein n=1 Tax=Paenibacillus ehimensis TaxID=79264 RepID=UPI000FD9E1F4|nr:stalk domain-containing protein [Paenibacillus ehimensis]